MGNQGTGTVAPSCRQHNPPTSVSWVKGCTRPSDTNCFSSYDGSLVPIKRFFVRRDSHSGPLGADVVGLAIDVQSEATKVKFGCRS